jgi:hypothetical protein
VSVSLPLRTPSPQVGAWQTPLQTLLVQSAGALHPLPGTQAVQAPPQSTSVSVPFFAPSLHFASAQTKLALQKPVWQSVPAPQLIPVAHLVHCAPPQSRALSVPFLTPSVQVGARHVPVVQTRLWQSFAPPQGCPTPQGEQGPPQSVADSPWFLIPSVQLGA